MTLWFAKTIAHSWKSSPHLWVVAIGSLDLFNYDDEDLQIRNHKKKFDRICKKNGNWNQCGM
jgi:hypothetical protein